MARNIFQFALRKKETPCLPESQELHEVTLSALELWLQGFSDGTAKQYRSIIDNWFEYVGSADRATRAQAIKYFAAQSNLDGQKGRQPGVSKKITKATLNRKRVIIKSFYKFLEHEGLADAKIFEFPLQVPETTPTKRPTEPLPMEKVEELLNLPSPYTAEGQRDRAILSMMLFTGCRRGEVRALCLGNYRIRPDGLGEVVSVKTKGGSPLTRVIPPQAAEALETYKIRREAEGATRDDLMFVTYYKDGKVKGALGEKWLYRNFKRWCEEVGIDSNNVSPHSCRVTLVTKLLQDGFDYGAVCAVTGHRSLEMAKRYDARFRKLEDSPALKIKY